MEIFNGVRRNLFIVFIFIVILAVGLGLGWFLGQDRGEDNLSAGQNNIGTGGAAQEDEILNKEGFSVIVPRGWKEAVAPTGVSAMVVNTGEEITDPALQKINFKSYYSVSYDTLGERTRGEYVAYIKEVVKQFAPTIIFSAEEDLKINGRDVYKLEADITQQGADFKVLIFLISGKGDDIWNMSFNSGLANWDKNKESFNRIMESFTTK
ncbi:MAG: PsbP-related protein [Patescibacteria group bacterium]|nr:PsbP-related protein [Patescibacteria group bacterium]